MSENTPPVKDVVDEFLESTDYITDKNVKKEKIETWRIDQQISRIEKSEQKMKRLENLDLSKAFNDDYINSMKKAQAVRVSSFRDRMPFINSTLTQMINVVAQELIFLGGKSGRGKSTTIANIIAGYLTQKKNNPNLRPILVISNEEKAESVLNRVICLFLGWNINDFKNFTQEQLDKLDELREEFIKRQYVVVIDPDFHMFPGAVFTKEGVEAILESALKQNYGMILMDYYQKFSKSEENPMATKVQVLTDISEYLDGYVKRSPAPVIIMGQLKSDGKDRPEFEDRIKESKSIYQNCTQAIEIITDKDKLKTVFIKRKDRWDQRDNLAVEVGFEKGRYVEYTTEFAAKVAHNYIMNAEKEEAAEVLGAVGDANH